VLAAPAVVLIIAANGIFRGLQDTRRPLLVTLGLNVVNLALLPVLIFGLGWGIAGAGAATLTAQWAGAIAFLVLVNVERRRGRLPLSRPRLSEAGPLLLAGRDIGIRTMALVATLTLATAVAAQTGTAAVAAHQVASQLWLLLALVVDALAIAAQAMIGLAVGRGDGGEVRRVSARLLWWGLGAGVVLGTLVYAFRSGLTALFVSDGAVAVELASVLPILAVSEPLAALVFVGDGIYLGASRFTYLAVTTVVAALAASAVLLLAGAQQWGLVGIWGGIVVLIATRAVFLATGYRSVTTIPSG
jgi:putative MATE family efflux protein